MTIQNIIKSEGWSIFLASQSPRRQELLTGCGVPFATVRYQVDESFPEELTAEEVPTYLSRLKSEGYPYNLGAKDLIITADTVVIRDSDILGKPKDRADAIAMLTSLAGRSHRVITGVTLRTKEQILTFSSESVVHFTPLSLEQIEYYVDNYRPYDKAGSYGCQEWLGYIAIERIEGSFYNVMGLPTDRLCHHLYQVISPAK